MPVVKKRRGGTVPRRNRWTSRASEVRRAGRGRCAGRPGGGSQADDSSAWYLGTASVAMATTGRRSEAAPVERWSCAGEVGGVEPVAAAVGHGRHAHDEVGSADIASRTVEAGIAEREDAPVRRDEPDNAVAKRRESACKVRNYSGLSREPDPAFEQLM